jgi:hypothetical protein
LRSFCAACALVLLSACGDIGFPLGPAGSGDRTGDVPAQVGATRLVERDVEAPDIFQVTEEGLWDGRPSMGGVWVAHPAARDPERVIIRNEENGRFVIGALFRRDTGNSGPAMMLSSDAAAALNILAGDPTIVQVTALRREPLSETTSPADGAETIQAAAPPGDPTAAAAAALARDEVVAGIAASDAAVRTISGARSPTGGALDRPYLQIGIFSERENAASAEAALRDAGLVSTLHEQTANDRRVWRVVAGPARTTDERDAMLRTVRGLGFADAFAVSG